MSDKEIERLEKLFLKLQKRLRCRYCIIPFAEHDGVSIATYDNGGDLLKSIVAKDLKTAIEKISE